MPEGGIVKIANRTGIKARVDDLKSGTAAKIPATRKFIPLNSTPRW